MGIHTVNALSISKIGELLIEQLGEDAADYTFPEDFEKAVVDIGFNANVYSGDSEPYDLIIIGNNIAAKPSGDFGAISKYKSITFIGNPQTIPYSAFRRYINLESIIIPDTVKTILDQAFNGCSKLAEVDFGSGCQSIGVGTFGGTSFTELTIPENIDNIGEGAFASCPVLESVTCYGAVALGSGQFKNDTVLKHVYAPKARYLGGNVNWGVFNGDSVLETVEVGSVGHPCDVVSSNVFVGCTNSSLSITIYTNNINTSITNIRNGATNATIIVKAASDLIYDGDSYEAGETVLTSEP